MAQLLIARGADRSLCQPPFGPPLHHAVARRYMAVAKALVEAGADVNQMDPAYQGRFALSYVQSNEHRDMKRFLREHGAVRQ